MKLINITLTTCLLFAIASCTREADIWERVRQNDVKLLSFGFYKEDNPSQLLKDYVVSKVSSGNIVVLLPANIDKSNLVARFTAGENDITRVGTTVQKSGETVNDFTSPIDYILSDGNNNAKYTVSISKGGDYIWTQVPFTIIDSATSISLKVNPATGDPYIMYSQSRPSSSDSKAAMVSFENNQWVNKGNISDGRISNFDFTFSSTGTPYASFADYTATPAQANTVKKFDNGTGWSLVGNKGLTNIKVSFNAIAFSNDSKLHLFSAIDGTTGPLLRRELGLATFENNNWTINGTMPNRPATLVTYLPVAKLKNDALYLGIYNAVNPNSISLYKYANNSWTTLKDLWRDPNSTGINLRDFDIDVDDEGNVYAAISDNSSANVYKLRVIKYSPVTQAVTSVGSYIIAASGNATVFDLAVSPNGTPYVFYRNTSNYPTIVSFDDETQDWSTPYTFEPEAGDELMFDFAPNGEAWVAYLKNRKMQVYKYSTP